MRLSDEKYARKILADTKNTQERKIKKSFTNIWQNKKIVVPLQPLKKTKLVILQRRDGRVVDYNGLENRRTERYRGFESLSLRSEQRSYLIIRELRCFSFF